MKIVIIDSGICNNFSAIKNVVQKYTIKEDNGEIYIIDDVAEDEIGHGTAVASIILKLVPNAELIIIKAFDNQINVNFKKLLYAMQFVNKEIECDLINISAGTTIVEEYEVMEKICDKLTQKNICIVAAFDNRGSISYPAALDKVIGIDSLGEYKTREEFTYIENQMINLAFGDVFYRVEWLNNQKTLVKGTSFATAYATGIVGKYIEENSKKSHFEILRYLEQSATQIIKNKGKMIISKPNFKVKKAILFPYNKEIHALNRYREQLKFEIVGVYDERLKGIIGEEKYGIKIQGYETINWEDDFDTLILGCCGELSQLTGKNYKEILIREAAKHQKNIYSFEEVFTNYTKLFYPKIGTECIPKNEFSKLRRLNTPILGVFGTSSKQGKFSLQIELKHQLEQCGYNVGHISTEPSGYLFDADFVFPMGYNSTIDSKVDLYDYISILNEQLWKIEREKKDIIIVGSQSGTIHYDTCNLSQYAICQHGFLLGTLPDCHIVCINPHDPLEYIKRTIDYLNSIDYGKVKAIVLYPKEAQLTKNGISFAYKIMNKKEIDAFKEYIFKETQIPIFTMGIEEEVKALSKLIIDVFCEED